MIRTWDLNSNSDRLKFLSIVELRDLLQDEDKIQQSISASLKLQALQQHKQMMLAYNHRLAEVNLSLQPHLNSGKLRLVERYLELGRMSGEIGRKRNRFETHQLNWKAHTMQTLLRRKVSQAMDQSEKLLKRFMGQRLSTEQFVDLYQAIRKLYHVRLIKLEKLKDLSKHMRKAEVTASSHYRCFWRQSEMRKLCPCVGSTMTSQDIHCPYATFLVKTPYVSPLDYHVCHHNLWKPTAAPIDSKHTEGQRVCRQSSRRPARPARLQRLHQRPKHDQRDSNAKL